MVRIIITLKEKARFIEVEQLIRDLGGAAGVGDVELDWDGLSQKKKRASVSGLDDEIATANKALSSSSKKGKLKTRVTDEMKREIYTMHRHKKLKQTEIMAKTGLSQSTISRILRGKISMRSSK